VLVLGIPGSQTQLVSADRYEPLPGLAQLPGWLWRRTSKAVRIGVLAALLFTIAGAAVLIPSISASRGERAAAERRVASARHAAAIRFLAAEQRPRYGRSRASAHPAMLTDLTTSILDDARRRVAAHALGGPIRRVWCEPFPRTVGGTPPELDPSAHDGRYSCVAVVADIDRSAGGESGLIGHPYRALLHFDSGRYAFCKISGRPDPIPDPAIVTPRACGG
jgi:hypothetical protein